MMPEVDGLSFSLNGITLNPTIDVSEVYHREDLSVPGFFDIWDIPVDVGIQGLTMGLIFRRMPCMSWRMVRDKTSEKFSEMMGDTSFAAKLFQTPTNSYSFHFSRIIERRIKSMTRDYGLREEALIQSFSESAEILVLERTVRGQQICCELYSHPNSSALLVATRNLSNGDLLHLDSISSEEFARLDGADLLSSKEEAFKALQALYESSI